MAESKSQHAPELTLAGSPKLEDIKSHVDDGVTDVESINHGAAEKLIRKIDMLLMPLLVISYIVQYLDKSSIANAAVMGIIPNLHLEGQEFSWVGSIFYVGYLVASYPVSVLFVRFSLGKTLAVSVILWGIVVCCHAAANSWASLMVVRTLLGVFESTVNPGFTLITSIWYTQSEHAARHGIWFAGNSVGAIFGALIAYGFAHITDGPIEPWRWLFIFLGIVTVVWGVVLFFRLPNSPLEAGFLSQPERIAVHERVQSVQKTIKNNQWVTKQFLEALKDPQVWLLCLFTLSQSMINGLVSNFSSIIVKSFGFTTLDTLLLNMPLYGFQLIVILISTYLAHRISKSRLIICVAGDIISLVGTVLIPQLPSSSGGRYAGILLVFAYSNNFALILSLISSNIGGFTKRSTTSAVFFISYCVGNLIGPQLVRANEAPKYQTAFTAMLAINVIDIVILLGLRFYLDQRNKRRDREQGNDVRQGQVIESIEEDQTDWQNKQFRYAL